MTKVIHLENCLADFTSEEGIHLGITHGPNGEAYVVRVECICDRLKSERRRTLSEVRRLSAEASSSFVEDSSASIALEWIGDKIDKLWRAT